VKSRYAIDSLARAGAPGVAPLTPATSAATPKPGLITQPVKERVIHVPDEQARQQGFKVR
jgi:hypothetical protein